MNDQTRSGDHVLLAGQIEIDRRTETIRFGGADTGLRGRNYEVLLLLLERAPNLVTKEEILDTVWANVPVTEGVLATALKEIRQTLGDDARDSQYIETRYGRGYRFKIAVQKVVRPDGGAQDRARHGPAGGRGRLALVRILAPVAVLVIAVAGWFLLRTGAQDSQRLSLQIDDSAAALKTGLERAFVATGLLDPSSRGPGYRLAISQSRPQQLHLTLSDARTAQALDARFVETGAVAPAFVARRIALETQNIIGCTDSLLADAAATGFESASIGAELVRLCLSWQFPDTLHDPVSISRQILQGAPASVFAQSLHALVIASQPKRYFFGHNNTPGLQMRAKAAKLAETAYLKQPDLELAKAAYALTRSSLVPLKTRIGLTSRVSIESWAGSLAGMRRVILLRQSGRIAEAGYLVSLIRNRWPGQPHAATMHMLLKVTQGNLDDAGAIARDQLALDPYDAAVTQLWEVLQLLYAPPAIARQVLKNASRKPGPDVRACFEFRIDPQPNLDAKAQNEIARACRSIDLTFAARILAGLGYSERALDILEEINPEAEGIAVVFYYPEFAQLRQSERFNTIARKFGLVDYWRQSGKMPDFCHQQTAIPVCADLSLPG